MRKTMALLLVLLALPASAAGDVEAGREKSKVCEQCHGPGGNSENAQFPRLAGQHPDYLIKALRDYQTGARKNPIMMPFAANLSPRDMEDLAAFFASQKGLFTR